MKKINKPADANQTGPNEQHNDSIMSNVSIASQIKSVLVALGLKGILPKKAVTFLINLLGLRSA